MEINHFVEISTPVGQNGKTFQAQSFIKLQNSFGVYNIILYIMPMHLA